MGVGEPVSMSAVEIHPVPIYNIYMT